MLCMYCSVLERNTMKQIITVALIVLTNLNCQSQTDSLKIREIEIQAYQIDGQSKKRISKKQIHLDSITVKMERFDNKIQAVSEFKNSHSKLKTEFYYESGRLILVRFSEESPSFKKDNNAYNRIEFYLENGKLIDTKSRFGIPNSLSCIGIPRDKTIYELYGYNKTFTSDFLKSYYEILQTNVVIRKDYNK